MWAVAKIKRKNLNVFIKELTSKTGTDIKFYYPKIQHHKYIGKKLKKIENYILENYIFCYHEKFSSINFTTEVQFIKGLDYFLKGHTKHQEELTSFINYCKSFENKDGYLTSVFFKTMVSKKAQFFGVFLKAKNTFLLKPLLSFRSPLFMKIPPSFSSGDAL